MSSATKELIRQANYGRMAFDVFLMEKWDYTADATQDKKQWDALARQYLAMKPRERHQYHVESARRVTSEYAANDNIVVNRVLPSLQTVQERRFCSRRLTHTSHDPALVRTYYGNPLHDDAHARVIKDAILEGLVDDNGDWNDKALYDCGDEDDYQRVLQHILYRVPQLCDYENDAHEDTYHADTQDQELPPPVANSEALERWLWSLKVATRLYITDREAMDNGKIKVFYLDVHGKAVWHHRFDAGVLIEYDGAWHSMNLAEIHGAFSENGENGCELLI